MEARVVMAVVARYLKVTEGGGAWAAVLKYSFQRSQKSPCKQDLIGQSVAKSFSPRILTGRTR